MAGAEDLRGFGRFLRRDGFPSAARSRRVRASRGPLEPEPFSERFLSPALVLSTARRRSRRDANPSEWPRSNAAPRNIHVAPAAVPRPVHGRVGSAGGASLGRVRAFLGRRSRARASPPVPRGSLGAAAAAARRRHLPSLVPNVRFPIAFPGRGSARRVASARRRRGCCGIVRRRAGAGGAIRGLWPVPLRGRGARISLGAPRGRFIWHPRRGRDAPERPRRRGASWSWSTCAWSAATVEVRASIVSAAMVGYDAVRAETCAAARVLRSLGSTRSPRGGRYRQLEARSRGASGWGAVLAAPVTVG